MKIKTANLSGIALDWAVAKCESRLFSPYASSKHHFAPSNRWSHGGPIIERIDGFVLKSWIESSSEGKCQAEIHNYEGDWIAFGPTILIAAMRCYVASKMGDTIEITEEDLL